ncbi:MAG: D-alanyl-D-alanine carboxypeptidase [Actinomycetota bacterium]|nr:D-alanyl-D-alanine carboxypeptidase [Actinomycetota bacterium]
MSFRIKAGLPACFGVSLVLFLLVFVPGPGRADGAGPELNAKSWAVIDARSGEPLASHRPRKRLPMASTTKLMTAWLAVRKLPLQKKVRAVDYKADPVESLMGLEAGQRISVRDLLYGLMMVSGNDAAETLAVAASGSVERFVAQMNGAARRMGLKDTHYENPIGLDGKRHYTSAADLATLGRTVMRNPKLRPIVGARVARLTSYSPPRVLETSNSFLLTYDWAHGIKTGQTMKAGYVLASDGRRRATELVGAVIGAPTELARNEESARLLDYGFSLYTKELPIRPRRPVVRVPVRFEDGTLALVSKTPVRVGTRADQELDVSVVAPDEVEGPIRKGQRLGRATVTLDGERIAAVPLLAAHAVEAPTTFDRLLAEPLLPIAVLVLVLCGILAVVLFTRRRRTTRARQRLQRAVRKRP